MRLISMLFGSLLLTLSGCGGGESGSSDEIGGNNDNTFEDGDISATITECDLPDDGPLTVFIKEPSWSVPTVHYWYEGPSGFENTTWPGETMSDDDADGWFAHTLNADSESYSVIFNDEGSSQTGNLSRATMGFYRRSNDTWYDYNPDTTLCNQASPPGGPFSNNSLQVTLNNSSVDTVSRYTTDGSDPASGTSFTDGTTITIGASLAVGETQTLRLYSSDGSNEVTRSFTYTKQANFNELAIYQIMVEAFQDGSPDHNYGTAWGPSHHDGDLQGIIDAMPYIASLNVNAIWMTPIFESRTQTGGDTKLAGTGYWAEDLFTIDDKFGTREQFETLVQTAHDNGLYVILDGVFGHYYGNPPASPQGNEPQGNRLRVSYPASLDYYDEVAAYWIDEVGIDGWRLDQVYQVPLPYLASITDTIVARSAARQANNETWGTLGYVVGEAFQLGTSTINSMTYGSGNERGINSAFDFPVRYALVSVLAQKEDDDDENNTHTGQPASSLNNIMNEIASTHPQTAMPNLFLTNHDVVRFGDLIERAGLASPSDEEYWARHRAAFAFMTAYSGPITIYYGDEIGAEVPDFAEEVNSGCGAIDRCDDHVSRTSGKITGLSSDEQALKDYLAELMEIRQQNPALHSGTRQNVLASSTLYADVKQYENNSVLFVLNTSNSSTTASISQSSVGGNTLTDLQTSVTINASGSIYSIDLDGLQGRFFLIE